MTLPTFSDWKVTESFVMTSLRVVLFFGCLLSGAVARSLNAGKDGNPMNVNAFQTTLVAATTFIAGYWIVRPAKGKAKSCKDEYPVNEDKSLTWRNDGGVSKLVPLHPLISESKRKRLTKYTMKEVATHDTKETGLWIVIDEHVYDITNFVARHPGGDLVLLNMAGKDCTDAFANYHSAGIYKTWLPPFLIGKVTDVPSYPHVQDFRNIRQELLRKGLFETSKTFYLKMYAWYTTLFLSSLYMSLACHSFGAHMVGALMMGFFWQQVAGLGHDLGHSSVTQNCTFDNWVGSTVGCALMGISTGWWRRSHNTHHVVCNSIENDPDIQHLPVLAISEKILEKPFWSSYHSKVFQYDAVSQFLVRHQHILFFPVLMVARFNLYAQSWILLLTTDNKDSIVVRNRTHEIVSLLVFASWVLGIALSMPTWFESVAWVLVSHLFTGLLHVQIVLSHYSMEAYHGNAYNDASDEWYTMQIKTSLDVTCPEWFDFFHIGLQHQVEHHLFPMLPRHNLRIARRMVKAVCLKHDIPYHEVSFFEGVKRTYLAMRHTAFEARSGKYDAQSIEIIRDLLNAHG